MNGVPAIHRVTGSALRSTRAPTQSYLVLCNLTYVLHSYDTKPDIGFRSDPRVCALWSGFARLRPRLVIFHRHVYAHVSGSQVREVTYTSGIGEAAPAGLRGEIVPADTQQRADTGNCTLGAFKKNTLA